MTASVVALKSKLRPSEEVAPANTPQDVAAMRRPLTVGTSISLILLAVFVWGSLATLSGAIVASGIVVVDGNSKKIGASAGWSDRADFRGRR